MDVKKIAIIGGGPSGLVALNEFLHTAIDGSSNIQDQTKVADFPEQCAFEKIVVFDHGQGIGGVWKHTSTTDPGFPQTELYNLPENVRPAVESPDEKELEKTTVLQPLVRPISTHRLLNGQLWQHGGVHDQLFTNIPNRLMHFSSLFNYNVKGTEKENNPFYPFATHQQVLQYVQKFASTYDLEKYIRFNSSVEKVYKKGNKWHVVVCQVDHQLFTEKWYMETFDAVVVSTGRFNVPFFPKINGMYKFVQENPKTIIHSKSFRNTDDLVGSKTLLVGGNISSIDLLQYLLSDCGEVWLSSNTSTRITNDCKPKNWIERCMQDQNLKVNKVPRIKEFVGNKVVFEDGTTNSGFDKIIFATGYHLYFPFLDIPENEGKEYIKLSSGRNDQENYAKTKVDNLYLYTFSVEDPTLVHLGIQNTPLFFMAAEANSIAIAGLWTNQSKLPSKEEQRNWCKNRFEGKNKSFQFYSEDDIPDFFSKLESLGPKKRLSLVPLLQKDEIKDSKAVLSKLFYKFAENTGN